ncbi:Ger(x)C family spore germination protein [Bacillus cereus]|uniref:Ger(x)C family spore germination protein n=1 Tax=Bacillus cereus TaxID=1396 RepID=UPI000279D4F6|nr:Ger(x)C family spore germination protein [Bacillus cereus]EJR93292.1 Ger(X)C family germination protein [Bacillus cereus VD200]
MKKIMRIIITIGLVSFLFILTGCLQKKIIDDVQLVQGVVVDLVNNKIKTTLVSPVQKKGNKVEVFENIDYTAKMGRARISLLSEKPFAIGQLRVALLTKKLAKKDIKILYDPLVRDSSIGHTVYLGLLEGSAKELFSGKYNASSNVAIYIKRLLEHNMQGGPVPHDNLYRSMYRYYNEGQDIFTPILKKEKNKIEIKGLALFKKEKYAGELNAKEMYIFKGLFEKHRLSSNQYKAGGMYVFVNNIRSTPSYHIDMKNKKPSFHIQVKIDTQLQEITKPINLDKQNNLKKIEKNIQKKLSIEGGNLIKKLQHLNVDPLGLGSKLKHKYRTFQLKEWKKIYNEIPIEVEYIVNISNSGVVE